jgi:hypothetical protein
MVRTSPLRHVLPRRRTALAALVAVALGWAGPTVGAEGPKAGSGPSADAAGHAGAFAALERADVEMLSKALDVLVADPALVEPFQARDRARLLAAAQPVFERLKAEKNITHFYFLEPEPSRVCFLRVHAPTLFGDVVKRDTFSQAIATHQVGSGKELGKTAFALRVVKPIRVAGNVVGYMELGEEIDHFLERMKAQTGDDYALLVDKKRVDRKELARVRGEDRWNERPDLVLIDSTIWNERTVKLPTHFTKLPDAGREVPSWTDGSQRYAGVAFPVRNAAGEIVGAMFVRHAAEAR